MNSISCTTIMSYHNGNGLTIYYKPTGDIVAHISPTRVLTFYKTDIILTNSALTYIEYIRQNDDRNISVTQVEKVFKTKPMNFRIIFCKKFKIPFKRVNTYLNRKRFINKMYDYTNIVVNDLIITKKYFKSKHFIILYLKIDNKYAYSDTFDKLYKTFTKEEKENLDSNLEINNNLEITLYLKLPNKKYTISDWGIFYPNNSITYE